MHSLSLKEVLTAFVTDCSERDSLPESLEKLAQRQNLDSQALKSLCPTLLKLEQAFYLTLLQQTLDLLTQDPTYANYDLPERLLALYYTLFEAFQPYRQVICLSLNKGLGLLQHVSKLERMKALWIAHMETLLEPALPWLEAFKKIQVRSLSEMSWLQFLSILGYWLHDVSPQQERSDVLIEKSVAASLELWNSLHWRHVPELLRFWIEELGVRRRQP